MVTIVAGAALLTLAYPPFRLIWPAFVCLVPAALLILRTGAAPNPWRERLHVGFWYGTVTQGALLYWLIPALWTTARPAVALWGVAAVMLGAVTAVMFAVVGRVADESPGRLALALPAGVVLLEWTAGQAGVLALPWHQLALTVTATPVLVQFADVAGSAGLAFVLAGINTLLALAWHERARPRASLRRIEAAATLLVLLSMYGLHRLTTTPLTSAGSVGVVQTAVAVDEKWRAGTEDLALRRTLRLTDRVRREGNPDLIVWPETTLRTPIGQRPDWGARIAQLARSSGAIVVAGSVAESGAGMEGSPSGRRTNAALAFDPTARGPEQARVIHEKQKLVPFVERVGPRWLNLSPDERRGFTAGEGLVTSNGRVGRYGAVVCYELTFPELARTLRRDGASLLVVVSNDAWLGHTTAVAQHFAHGVLRAVENRMAVVRSSNAGISGVIDPLGRVAARTESFGEDVVVGSLYRTGTAPLAASIGGWAGPVALVLLILLWGLGLRAQLHRAPASAPGPRPAPSPLWPRPHTDLLAVPAFRP